MSDLFSWRMFCSRNEFLKYIKGLTFGPHEFSIISPCCTILDIKIESITSLCRKIKAAKIAMQIFKILRRLWHRLIRWFLLLSVFYTIITYLSWNKSLQINSISYFRQLKNILITQVTHLMIPSLNRYKSNCIDNLLIKSTIWIIASCGGRTNAKIANTHLTLLP